ncbi:unnamed protein product [Auanema sp. JU1783]|nr:unnamed protein product [Auanema sp. JU1783]
MYELLSFPSWIPSCVTQHYHDKGIKGLFQWQHEVLSTDNGIDNLLISAPTSAGKSIVAELLALKIALKGKRVLFVLPYISVAKEKLNLIQKIWRSVDLQVAGFIGATSAPSREWIAAVCTMEKANSLLNHALQDGTFHEYGMIVLDEIHMLDDPSRGGTLENLATKILFCNKNVENTHVRLLGMSATLPNLEKIKTWMSAEVKVTDFRPIELNEFMSYDGFVYDMRNKKEVRKLDVSHRYPGDVDCSVGFSVEAVYQKKQTLVFCSSKNEVENTALEIAKQLDGCYRKSSEMESRVNKKALLAMKADLEQFCREIDPILMKTLPRAVAYHHAGLTSEERECIEKAFREGVVLVLVATSTLSSGVNMPAYRVIIKSQTRGPAAISSTTYQQMAGRAGRLGQSENVDAIRKSAFDDFSEEVRCYPLLFLV